MFNSSDELAPQFQRCQFCFGLDTLVVIEIDVIINELPGLFEGSDLCPVDTLRFEDGEEVFSQSVIIRIPAS